MKKTLLTLFTIGAIAAQAQTVLLQDNFEVPSANWTLNAGTGDNRWIVNNSYTGWMPVIVNTPSQPAGVTNGPNSTYLHIVNTNICSFLSACNANFDTGSNSDHSATLSTPLNTVGMQNISISFFYVCAGQAGVSFGTLEYSTDMGSTWANAGTYSGVTGWTSATVSMVQWDNQPSLLFRFRWQNGGSGADPAFSVDEIEITAGSSGPTITTSALNPSTYCPGDSIVVPYTVTGSFTGGNVFTAILSDASGSFASPTVIGFNSSILAGSVLGQIPASTAAGTGYLVRVVSSTPMISGTDATLVIDALPVITAGGNGTICSGATINLTATGGGVFEWEGPGGFSSTMQNPSIVNATAANSGMYIVTVTNASGCTGSDSTVVIVDACLGAPTEAQQTAGIFPNPSDGLFFIHLPENASVTVTDMTGKSVYASRTSEKTIALNAAALGMTPGIYLVKIEHAKETTVRKLIIK